MRKLLLFTSLSMLLTALAPVALIAGEAYAPQAFTATYKVTRKGTDFGTSTLQLKPIGNDTWELTSSMTAESGLASALGASISETSTFQYTDDAFVLQQYAYKLDSAIKSRSQHIQVDWENSKVNVDTEKDSYRYDSKPGMLDPNLLVLALKRQVSQGDKSSTLDLARKKELKAYHYELGKKETIETPAGTFKTQAVDRVRDDKNFTAWYATDAALQVPVELTQDTAGGISLLLQSYESKAD